MQSSVLMLTCLLRCIEVEYNPGPAYTPVPLIESGKRMVALTFDLTKAEVQSKPSSEKVTKYGTVTIVAKGGVGNSAYATGWKINKNYLRYTHGDYSVAISKEHRTFIAWLAVYVTVLFAFVFVNNTVICSGIGLYAQVQRHANNRPQEPVELWCSHFRRPHWRRKCDCSYN